MLPLISAAIVLQLSNLSGARAFVVEQAQREVTRVYAGIGVPVEWTTRDSVIPERSRSIRVVLLADEVGALRLTRRTVLGAAVATDAGTGVAYVFYRRVQAEADRHAAPVTFVLACAIAHELGHLLLPGREHGLTGLMRAYWTREEFQEAQQGRLKFSADEVALIRARLSAHEAP